MGLPMASQGTPLGAQSHVMDRQTHTGRENLSTETQEPELHTDRGVAMNNQETAPEDLGLPREKPPPDLEAVDIANQVLVTPLTAKDIQET